MLHVANNSRAEKNLAFVLKNTDITDPDDRDNKDNLKLNKNNIERYLLFY